jgi:hypothetical protein
MAKLSRICFYFGVLLILGFVQLQSGCTKQAETPSVAQEQEPDESKNPEVHEKLPTASVDDENEQVVCLVSIKHNVDPKLIRRFLKRYHKFAPTLLEQAVEDYRNENEPSQSQQHKSGHLDWDSWMSECSTEYNVPRSTLASLLIDYRLLTELNQRE